MHRCRSISTWTPLPRPALEEAFAIASDAQNNIYVVGRTLGNLDGNTSLGGSDFFLVSYDHFGAKQ
jgi:hypothetical protein